MSQIHRVSAAGWSTGTGPEPARSAVETMLTQLEVELRELAKAIGRDVQPIAVVGAESWRGGDAGNVRRFLSELSIEIGPGRGERSLRAWFQHQHARFNLSQRAFPNYVVKEGAA
jgi:hypothetical protein